MVVDIRANCRWTGSLPVRYPGCMAAAEKRILAALVDLTLRAAATLGIERSHLLAVAGLTEENIADRDAYVPLSAQIAVHVEMSRQVSHADFGLTIAAFARASTLGVLGYTMANSATLGVATASFVRFSRLLGDFERWSMSPGGGDEPTRLAVAMAPEIEAHSDTLALPALIPLASWMRIGRTLTGVEFQAEVVMLRGGERIPTTSIQTLFGGEVRLDAAHNCLLLSERTVSLPVVGSRPALRHSFLSMLQARLDAARDPGSYADEAFALIMEKLPSGAATKDQIARALGVGARTLTRRLRAEQTSFRQLLDRARQELAEMWLANPDNAVYEVAYLLGYSEPSAFHRTFRRWTGLTPNVWRQRRTTRWD